MKTKNLIVLALIVILSGCDSKKQIVARVKLATFTMEDLYDQSKAYDMIFDSEELPADSVKTKSKVFFLQGVDLYKNKKNAAGAVELFKKSNLIFPDPKVYYELGNALVDSKGGKKACDEALKAYGVAEYLNFKPASMLYYKMACARNLRSDEEDNSWGVVSCLRRAFNEGFSDTTMISKDENLKSIIASGQYRSLIAEMAATKFKNNPEDLFDTFVKSFPVVSQPYEISFEAVDKTGNQSISYDFAQFVPEMQNTSFGRETSNDFYAIAKIAETPKYIALIYSSVNFYGEEMQPGSTKLVTYTPQGEIISSKLFACQFSAEKIKIGKIDHNEIMLQDYEREWEMPIDKVPFEENKVTKHTLIAKAQYLLDDSGKILEQSVPSNYTDSVVKNKKILSFLR